MTCPSSDDYGQPIVPEGSATVQLPDFGMPTAFQLGIRQFGHAYYAELQLAARTMRLGMEGGRDPVDGDYHEPVDPCVLLQPILLSAMQRATGFVEVTTEVRPMQETERTGKGITRRDQIRDLLWDLLAAVAEDLRTGEGLCFCVDGVVSDRAIARATNRLDSLFPDTRFGLLLTDGQ